MRPHVALILEREYDFPFHGRCTCIVPAANALLTPYFLCIPVPPLPTQPGRTSVPHTSWKHPPLAIGALIIGLQMDYLRYEGYALDLHRNSPPMILIECLNDRAAVPFYFLCDRALEGAPSLQIRKKWVTSIDVIDLLIDVH